MYADPMFMSQLGERLGDVLELGLAHSTHFACRVIWPRDLTGTPLFTYTTRRRGPGILNRLKDAVLPLMHCEVSEDVTAYLARRRAG